MAYPAAGIDLFFMEIYGGFGFDRSALGAYLGLATGRTQTGNPPFNVSGFKAFYPQFFGPGTSIPGTVTVGSNTITAIASTTGIEPGQLVSGPFPGGTVVTEVTSDSVTVSNLALSNASAVNIFMTPPVPLFVVQAYLNLANASLMSSRWREMWPIAMGWYIAHFLTLYLQASGNVNSTPGQIAAQGLEQGITASQSAGSVSFTQENLVALQSWGAWTKTAFGTQLISQAQVVGAGAVYIR